MVNIKNKAVFLDRDGVINKEIGYLHKITDFIFIEGVFKSCNYFLKNGFKLIIITNQSGIGRGYYQEKDFYLLNQWMHDQFERHGITILETFFCPHLPEQDCNCRKPKPGLIKEASQKYNIDLKNSWMIGDKEVDIKAANSAGISNTILVQTGHKIDESKTNAKYVLKSINETVQIIN
jgi:D-glycero-D-manno-heptose 1,7-bisphosphate phosphatase